MNKIILDKSNNIELEILEDSICNISKDYDINNLSIILRDNVKFILNYYNEVSNSVININVKQHNNSEFIYNHSFINNGDYLINCNIDMNGNKSKNIINIHGISDNGKTNIKVDGSVCEDTFDNKLDEKIKMININNGVSFIEPNMFINTKNVIANHAASISDFNKDYLFYLNSKGLNNLDAKELIINGFLKNDAK